MHDAEFTKSEQTYVRVRRGRTGTFFSGSAGLWGMLVGTFQAGFIVTMKTEVRVNTPHRAGTTPSLALHSLTKRTRISD